MQLKDTPASLLRQFPAENRAIRPENGEEWPSGVQLPETGNDARKQAPDAAISESGDGSGYIRRDRCLCCEFICPAWFVKDGLCQNCANGVHLSPEWGRCLNKPDVPEHLKEAQPRYLARAEPQAKGRGRRQQQPASEPQPKLLEH